MNEIDFEYVEDASTLILRAGPDAPTERLALVGDGARAPPPTPTRCAVGARAASARAGPT